jgi:hypothetical protein
LSHGDTHGHANGNAYTHGHPDSNAYGYANADGNADSYSDKHSDRDGYPNTDGNADGHSHSYGHCYSHGDPAACDSNRDAYARGQTDADAQAAAASSSAGLALIETIEAGTREQNSRVPPRWIVLSSRRCQMYRRSRKNDQAAEPHSLRNALSRLRTLTARQGTTRSTVVLDLKIMLTRSCGFS